MARLTPKQALFVDEYLIDLNATQAAIRAGYSKATAGQTGFENLKKPYIAAEIAKRAAERAERTQINSDYVLTRLREIDELDVVDLLDDVGNILPVSKWPKSWRTLISGFDLLEVMSGDTESMVRKIKFPDKVKNLELLGRHVDIQAWKDVKKIEGELIQKIETSYV